MTRCLNYYEGEIVSYVKLFHKTLNLPARKSLFTVNYRTLLSNLRVLGHFHVFCVSVCNILMNFVPCYLRHGPCDTLAIAYFTFYLEPFWQVST